MGAQSSLRMLLVIVFASFASNTFSASEGSKQNEARQPVKNPDPTRRTVPELVCEATELRLTKNLSLESEVRETPFRIRFRGNVLYLGTSASDEKFAGIINKTDRLRWSAGNATIVISESFAKGTWVVIETDKTYIRPLACQPFDTSKR